MSTPQINLELVTQTEQFRDLQTAWAELLSRSNQDALFLQWEWLYSWWQVFSNSKRQLQIVICKTSDVVVGIAPLYLHRRRFPAGPMLRFIGTGEAEKDHVLSEYLDVIAAAEFETAVVEAIAAWLKSQSNWRVVQFDDVLGSALTLDIVQSLGADYKQETRTSGLRYAIELGNSLSDYLERLSASRRKRYKRCSAALVKDGGSVRTEGIESLSDIETKIATLKKLNNERWRQRAGGGVFESSLFLRFHSTVCKRLWPEGQADIKVLKINDRALAALYVFYSGSTCYYYQSGFSGEGANRYMPLFLCHLGEIEACIDKKMRRYDFMRGAADSYKKDYACESDPMFTSSIWRYPLEKFLHGQWLRFRRQIVILLRKSKILRT